MIDWSKSHCGVMLCSFGKTVELMPETKPVLDSIIPHLELDEDDYLVDVKVHMLMPGEYPCLPNWHTDFVPRDNNLKKLPKDITGHKMYLWISGEPKAEWKNAPPIITSKGYDWVEFTQRCVHRGVKSKVHIWRCFIRIIPKWFVHHTTINIGQQRRHTQVYIDNPDNFRW